EAVARLTRIRLPRPRLVYPLHRVVGGLFGAAVVTVSATPMPTAHVSTATQPAATQPAADQPAAGQPAAGQPAAGQAVPSAAARSHHDAGAVPDRPQPGRVPAG